MSGCTCTVTDPKTWTTCGSAVEPGSMMEPNPFCTEHFPEANTCAECKVLGDHTWWCKTAPEIRPEDGTRAYYWRD